MRTIRWNHSSVNIRSLTVGAALPQEAANRAQLITQLGQFAHAGRAALQRDGYTVQTVRLATQPLERWLVSPSSAPQIIAELGEQCAQAGIDYCSLGTIQAGVESIDDNVNALLAMVPDLLMAAENVFASVQVGVRGGAESIGGINLNAVRAAARTMQIMSGTTEAGFGNLRFAAAANCPPHIPFFPAAYYVEDDRNRAEPEFGLALEAADLAVLAINSARTHEEARQNLLALLVEHGTKVVEACGAASIEHGYTFTGLDISMAPYPAPDHSIGRALEALSGAPFGGPGTLAAATFITGALKEARTLLPTVGYSGLMLPLLEDQTLADRAAEGLVTLDTLLLLSAVCGLGLDIVPLPGDVSLRQLERIILDMASLAIRLDKPLTARLLPVPGRSAGEIAEWPDFPYFAKGRVMSIPGTPGEAQGLFNGDWLRVD